MNSKEFLKNVFESGEATSEEIVKFMIKNYFIKGYSIKDFENDLIVKYGKNELYAEALVNSFMEELRKWSK